MSPSKEPVTSELHRLLIRMCQGDDSASQAIYDEYAPYLKIVVRRRLTALLRPRFDSSDVVQSVWADLVQGFRRGRWTFESPEHFRAFLVRATRNRLVDYVRKHGPKVAREESWDEQKLRRDTARPSGEAKARERWEQILDRCPESQKRVVEMKRDGHSLQEIAEATGFHPSSIRRMLYTLAKSLAPSSGEAS